MKINLIKVGQNIDVNFEKLKNSSLNSKIFNINEIQEIQNPPYPNPEFASIEDLDFINPTGQADFWIAIIDKPLWNNYYSWSISNKKLIVISVYDMESINILDGISNEKFILRFIYSFATIFKAYGNRMPDNNEVVTDRLMQTNTQGCLFDFCLHKKDFTKFFKNPKLSIEAEAVLNTKTLPVGFLNTLKSEILMLKPGKLVLLKSWISKNVIVSILFSIVVGIVSNIISNFLIKYLSL